MHKKIVEHFKYTYDFVFKYLNKKYKYYNNVPTKYFRDLHFQDLI